MPTTDAAPPPSGCRSKTAICRLIATVSERTALADYPHAASVGKTSSSTTATPCAPGWRSAFLRALQAEWGKALMDGPGVIVLQRAVTDMPALEQVNRVFRDLIAGQHASGQAGGDHFAKPGANDRIWNAQQKLCLRAPRHSPAMRQPRLRVDRRILAGPRLPDHGR
jgi:hypothetical protein